MPVLCIDCNQPVRPKQHAITCDVCDRWQHRTCNTNITLQQYRLALADQLIINFTCHGCTVQPNQNTSDIDDDLLPSFNRDDVHDLSSDHEEMDQSADLILPLQKNRGETTH